MCMYILYLRHEDITTTLAGEWLNSLMYHFAWVDKSEKQGYTSDVLELQLVVPWENKPLIQICN